jgi:hypothetical protein
MGNPAEEKLVFESFLLAAPLFGEADVVDRPQPGNDPPDIECKLVNGRKIGIELTSWLDRKQITRAKPKEYWEISIREAIKPVPPNETEHIHVFRMFPKRTMRGTDAAAFRRELLKLTEEIDQQWSSGGEWDTPQGFLWHNFSTYPILGEYLEAVDIQTRIPSLPTTMEKGDLGWITFPMRGGGYSPDWMVDALCECIWAKIAKYSEKPAGVDEFHLLIHYDRAFHYNTPVIGIDFGYAEAVQAAAARVGSTVGAFEKIFVFVPINEKQQVFRMYPA